jgi:hypothetical protein
MTELIFPVASIVLLGVVVIPIITLLVKGALWHQKKRTSSFWDFGSDHMFHFLILPVLAPFIWLFSSSIHLNEAHWWDYHHAFSCLLSHGEEWGITDEGFLLAILVLGSFIFLQKIFRENQYVLEPQMLVTDLNSLKRLEALSEWNLILKDVDIVLVENWDECAAVVGIFRPKIILNNSWIQKIDDSMLLATLLHEVAHAKQKDVLRGGIIQVVLRINCVRRYLEPSFGLWIEAREVHADAQAIAWGADSLALAESIVQGLRWKKEHSGCKSTAGMYFSLSDYSSVEPLRLRLALLLNQENPLALRKSGWLNVIFEKYFFGVVWMLIMTSPHLFSWDALGAFHYHIERIALSIGGHL